MGDHDRPLSSRGQRASGLIAGYLQEQGISPERVLCSSSVRTRETLERISAGFAGEVKVQIEEGLYGTSAGDLLARLRKVEGDTESLMVIGHDPAIPARNRLGNRYPDP